MIKRWIVKNIPAFVAIGLITGTVTPVMANSLPVSGGIYVNNSNGNGNFYAFDFIATNTQLVQNAINNAGGLSNVYLDIGGVTTNFGQFIQSGIASTLSNATFTTYATANPYTIPNGITVYSESQGVYSYNPGTVLAPPASAPSNVVVTSGLTSASVAFDAVTGATGYTALLYNGSGNQITTQTGTTSPIVLNGLSAGTNYIVAVEATNSAGTGPASVMKAFTTSFFTPVLSNVQAQNGQITVMFSQPLSSSPSVSDFTILQSLNGASFTSINASSVSMNASMTQAILTIPQVASTSTTQSVVDTVQFDGSLPMSSTFTA